MENDKHKKRKNDLHNDTNLVKKKIPFLLVKPVPAFESESGLR